MVTTDFLYNLIGVLYGYREDDLKCANGAIGSWWDS